MLAQKQMTIFALVLATLVSLASPLKLQAGNPIAVTKSGQPYRWEVSDDIKIYPETGDLGKYSNSEAISKILEPALAAWEGVSTARVRWNRSNVITTDIQTVQDVQNALNKGYNPIVFDQGGKILAALGLPTQSVLALTGLGGDGSKLVQGYIIINGLFLDGNPANGEVTQDAMISVLIHELGHFLGLGHSQVNGHMFLKGMETDDPSYRKFGPPPADAPVETMFPYMIQGVSKPRLSRDDEATVSTLCPAESFKSLGAISGTIFRPSRTIPFQGANVVARNVSNPYADAVSAVSGALYHGSFEGGSSELRLKGLYEIGGLTPDASYTIEATNLVPVYSSGSSIGPLYPHATLPGPPEFYNGAKEGVFPSFDDPMDATAVCVRSGETVVGIDIYLNLRDSADLPIPNPGFEDSGDSQLPEGWETSWLNSGQGDAGRLAIPGANAYEGKSALRLHVASGGGSIFVLSDPFDALPNRTYLLSCRMRFYFEADNERALFTVVQYDGQGNDLGPTEVMAVRGDSHWSWALLYNMVRTNPNTAYLRIRFGLLTPNERYLDIDDVRIETQYGVQGRVTNTALSGVTIEFSLVSDAGSVPSPVMTGSDGYWSQSGFLPGYLYRATARRAGETFVPSSLTFNTPRRDLDFSAESWHSESVNWLVNYGNNWNRSGVIVKQGATKIRLHFSLINVEPVYDRLASNAGDAWSGSYVDVTSNDRPGDTLTLTLTSDSSRTGYFIIDRVEYLGNLTGPATRSGPLFQPDTAGTLIISFYPNPVARSADGKWRYSVFVQETAGVGVTLTGLTVGGSDYTGKILEWFRSNHIPAYGQVTGSFETWTNASPPLNLRWEFAGNDDNGTTGGRWSGLVQLLP